MLIDLTEKFLKIRRENKLLRNREIEESLFKEYILLREELSKNKFCEALKFKYPTKKEDINEEENWNQIQLLANDIFFNSQDKKYLENLKEDIKTTCSSIESVTEEINDFISVSVDAEYEPFFNFLLIIEDSMVKISNFREYYIEQTEDETYVFTSKLDLILTGDYLRLSLLEDFILDQGFFQQ